MPLHSGFFNAFRVDGVYDRKYNADDYSSNLGALIRTGVLRDGNNGFQVKATGLVVSVSPGRAWIEGRWAYLDLAHTFPAVTPPIGEYSRIDSVVLRLDTNANSRDITLHYMTGIASSSPAAPALSRADGIYEIALAHITVAPNASLLTVRDTRGDQAVCGWVTTPVGYDDYFAALDGRYTQHIEQADNEWQTMKDNWASTTLFKQYVWRTVLDAESNAVAFNIPQYDPSGVDIINVYVNGLREVEGIDYTLSGSVITFGSAGGGNGVKIAGTEIVVICYKSIDGAGLRSVSDEITRLQNQVATLGDITDYNYICTGLNDNHALSEIAQNFLAGENDSKTMTIHVYGTVGVSSAYGGSGTAGSPYRWFAFGTDVHTSRRICFDFSNCSRITFTCPAGTHNVIFYGHNVRVKNAKMRVDCNTANSSCIGFNSASGTVLCENCVIQIYGYSGCYLSATGTFRDCSVAVFNSNGVGRCFVPTTASFLRVFGGDFSAYAAAGRGSAVFFVASGLPDAVVIANAVNCPTAASSGYAQEYAVYDLSANGKCAYNNIVSTLSMSATSQVVSGTTKANKTVGAW